MRTLNSITAYISSFLVIAAVIIVMANVITRYFFNYSLAWSVELTRFFFIWITFLGSAVALAEGKHLVMDAFFARFPLHIKKVVEYIHLALTVIFLSIILYFGIEVVNIVSKTLSPSLQIKMTYVYLALPVGIGIMLCFLLDNLIRKLRTKGGE